MTIEKPAVHRDVAAVMPTLRRLRDSDRTVEHPAEDIRGRMVKDNDGQDLGRIGALLIDDGERHVRFMEVATGGFLGFGEAKSFIPVEAITRITDNDVYISHTREHVAGAPPYDPDLVASDPGYFFGLYPYYGYSGYPGFFPSTYGYHWAMGDMADEERPGR